MFEQELYNQIKNNFTVTDFSLSFGFGEISETAKAPYIVMFPLTNDGTRQVLCNTDNYTDGETTIQFNVYAFNYPNACYIGRELDIFLSSLTDLTTYDIILNNTEVIRGFETVNTGISIETITRRFTYTKK